MYGDAYTPQMPHSSSEIRSFRTLLPGQCEWFVQRITVEKKNDIARREILVLSGKIPTHA